MKCPECNGSGRIKGPDDGNCSPLYVDCPRCNGTGQVPDPLPSTSQMVNLLSESVQGLTYPSETDAPLEAFSIIDKPESPPLGVLLQRLAENKGEPIAMPLNEFLETLRSANSNGYQVTTFEDTARKLGNPEVWRIGEIQVTIVLVGKCSDGWAGIKTLSVET